MGAQVSKQANDRWLADITPIKGEFRSFMVGLAAGAFFHEYKFGLKWEREQIIYRLQKFRNPIFAKSMWFLGQFCSADFMVPYFATLFWVLDKFKCIYGIWLIPVSEIVNGMLKWYFRVPRPGWIDKNVEMRAWSHEYSFPSSHAQMIWALATFFSGTSVGTLRNRLYGSVGSTAVAYWYFLLAPFLFAASVGLSRVYEGVHYPRDIIVGSGIGVGLASVYLRMLPSIQAFYRSRSTIERIILLQTLAFILSKAVSATHARTGASDTERLPAWIETAAVGEHKGKDLRPHAVPLSNYHAMVGVLSGLGVVVPLFPYLPAHQLPVGLPKALLRVSVGQIACLGVYFFIRYLEKTTTKDGTSEQRIIRFCRYFSLAPMILVVSPAIFRKLGI